MTGFFLDVDVAEELWPLSAREGTYADVVEKAGQGDFDARSCLQRRVRDILETQRYSMQDAEVVAVDLA